MKTLLLIIFLSFNLGFGIKAFGTSHTGNIKSNECANANTGHLPNPGMNFRQIIHNKLFAAAPAQLSSITQLLRLKLYLDQYNYDDIVIGFNSGASTTYNYNDDSRYLSGINAPEGLSSFSSDGVQLAVNLIPLPNQSPLTIRLDVEARNSGTFILQRTELDSIPPIYELWLVDKYKRDSLDLRANDGYALTIDKKDSASFGSNRFEVVVRQNPLLAVHLLSFDAIKGAKQTQLNWTTENQQNYTHFAIERSIDDGRTFFSLDTLTSSAAGNYSFVDNRPVNGVDMYRLNITDLNGTVSYSNIISIDFGNPETSASTLCVYPNPSNGMLNVAISANNTIGSFSGSPVLQSAAFAQNFTTAPVSNSTSYGIKIISINGTVIKTATSSSSTWSGSVAGLAPGNYVIQVVNNNSNSLVGVRAFIKL
jgi:hypothetical protein